MRRILFNNVNAGSYRGEKSESSASIGIIDTDTQLTTAIDFDRFGIEGQVNWAPALTFADGKRIVVLSMEEGLCHLDTTRTHLWIYDLGADRLEPLLQGYRPVPYATAVGLLPGENRIITGHNSAGVNRHVISDLDGGHAEEIPLPDDGFSYCLQPSPDSKRVAFHTSSKRGGYRISVMNWDGSDLVEVAGDAEHLFFGPSWSADGQWLLFADCRHRQDPEHMRSDLCVVRPDGADFHRLTEDQSHWLSPVYGGPDTKGGGSEVPHWMPDGRHVTCVRLKPGSVTPWPLQENPAVDDHFNRDFRPGAARGGTDLCLLDVFAGTHQVLTNNPEGVWDFRATPSSDGSQISFCRSRTGEPSELWLLDVAGGGARYLTTGMDHSGIDHPKWMA